MFGVVAAWPLWRVLVIIIVIVIVIVDVVVVVATERGYLDDFPAKAYMNDAKAAADHSGIAEQFVHFLGSGIRGHIEIFGMIAQQQVANRTAHQESLEALAAQTRHYLESAIADIFAGYRMAVPGYAGGCSVCRCHWLVSMLMRELRSLPQGNGDGENSVFPIQVSPRSLIVISEYVVVLIRCIRTQSVLLKISI